MCETQANLNTKVTIFSSSDKDIHYKIIQTVHASDNTGLKYSTSSFQRPSKTIINVTNRVHMQQAWLYFHVRKMFPTLCDGVKAAF